MNYFEKSSYFKGLLLLIKKDRVINDQERKLMQNVGKILGFEKDFIQNSINDILENEYISEEIPTFSSESIAKSFVYDCLKISLSDNDFAPEEIEYLTEVVQQNKLDTDWFSSTLKDFISNFDLLNQGESLYIEKYLSKKTKEIQQLKYPE